MLKKLRKKKTKKMVWIVLAVIIVPAFILWGAGGLLRSKRETNYAGKIFGKKISFLEYRDALEAIRNLAIIQYGDKFSEVQKYLDLESQTWERLVLLAEAKKHKINISDKEVIEQIKNYPFFQKKGKFDETIYSQLLQYVFRTPARRFEEQTRQNVTLIKLYNEITKDVTLTEEEIRQAYRKSNEQISIYYLASLYSDFSKDIKPQEETLKDYFSKNSLQFKQPLSFNLEYVSSESEETIKKLFSRLNKAKDFAKIAKDFNLAVKETGLFKQTDAIPGLGWSPQILALISKLNVGQFTPPLTIDKSCYILRLKERKDPFIPEFQTIKDKVKEAYIQEEAKKLAKTKIENALKRLKEVYKVNPKAVDFSKVANEFGIKSGSTGLFKYASYIEGIGVSDNFWMEAQKLKENEFSEIINMDLSGFYIIKLKTRQTIDEKKFQQELDGFKEKLLLEKKQEEFSKFIEGLKRKAQLF